MLTLARLAKLKRHKTRTQYRQNNKKQHFLGETPAGHIEIITLESKNVYKSTHLRG